MIAPRAMHAVRRPRGVRAAIVLALGMASACACSRETAASPPGDPSKGEAAATDSPSPLGAGAAHRCPPWVDAASFIATAQGGRREAFRKFEYDFASGALRVHDSDPFATGKESPQPRVTDDTTTLSGAAKDHLEQALFAVCPGAEAMARRCAPGGCQRLTVTDHAGKTTRVEDPATVGAGLPKLRTP
jgi:hypothetical protein